MSFSFGGKLLDPAKPHEQRRRILPILEAALEAVEPYAAVRRTLSRKGHSLRIANREYDLNQIRRVLVVGAGKAGAPMTRAVEDVLGDRLAGGSVNVKHGHAEPTRYVSLCEAGHPIPDEAGVGGTQKIVDLLRSADATDLVVCLISGGGSSLLQLPNDGIALSDVQLVTEALLRAGATIDELNTVRKHLSQVTGGTLARLAYPAHVAGLILSDVVGNPLDVIASGPTVPDTSTFAEAVQILARFELWENLPSAVRARLGSGRRGEVPETPKAGDPSFERVQNVLVASNDLATRAAADKAARLGFNTLVLTTYLEGEAREVARVFAALAREIVASERPLSRPCCLIAGGETTVTVRGSGRGGRNQELALAAAPKLHGLTDVLLVALATDGNDGPTDAAGALSDGTTIERARRQGLDPFGFLANNNAYAFFDELGDLLLTGPTKTNVNDLLFLFAF